MFSLTETGTAIMDDAHVLAQMQDPRRPSRTLPNPTELLILRSAIERFGRLGYGSTSVRTIAQAAGVTAPLINYHFSSKEGLFHRCVDAVFESMVEAVLTGVSGISGLRDVLRCMIEAYLRFSDEYPDAMRFLLSTVYGPSEAQPQIDVVSRMAPVQLWLGERMQRALREGEFRPRGPAKLSLILRNFFLIIDVEILVRFERRRMIELRGAGAQLGDLPVSTADELLDQFLNGMGSLPDGLQRDDPGTES
jgi:AcrR family transcriptional regulator